MIPSKTIIVYMGRQGHGKDFASSLAISLLGKENAERHSFADLLRSTCWSLFRNKINDKERIYGDAEKKAEQIPGWEIPENISRILDVPLGTLWSGRRLLQYFGTEICRQSTGYDDIWVDVTKLNILESNKSVIMITDCRFPNEYKMLESLKQWASVHFVWIERKGYNIQQFSNHASEAYIEKFHRDEELINTGNYEEFKHTIEDFLSRILPNYEKNAL